MSKKDKDELTDPGIKVPVLEVAPKFVPKPEVVPVAPEVAPPASSASIVALDVYCLTSGRKPDQNKAFAAWATRQGHRAMTMAEWHGVWAKFQNRAV